MWGRKGRGRIVWLLCTVFYRREYTRGKPWWHQGPFFHFFFDFGSGGFKAGVGMKYKKECTAEIGKEPVL